MAIIDLHFKIIATCHHLYPPSSLQTRTFKKETTLGFPGQTLYCPSGKGVKPIHAELSSLFCHPVDEWRVEVLSSTKRHEMLALSYAAGREIFVHPPYVLSAGGQL